MAQPPAFLQYQVSEGGQVLGLHQTTLLRFRHTEALTWRGGLSVPVYWATLFSEQDVTASGATVEWADALGNLERRRDSWKAKASPLLFRGFPRFLEWVRGVRGGAVTLEVSGLDPWRREPLMAAVRSLLAFLDDRATDPGLLLAGFEVVGWVKRKKGLQLGARTGELRWPDEVPLFAVRSKELATATMGEAPFRRGPWPERRFAEDQLAPLPAETDAAVKQRAALVAKALGKCPNELVMSPIGNLEGIERLRAHHRSTQREFEAAARELAESAKDFAARYQVFDDTALWSDLLDASARWARGMEASLSRHEAEVREAMRSAGAGEALSPAAGRWRPPP